VGVLALQGDVREHFDALEGVGAAPVEVRTTAELAAVDALIIPGGESTTIARLLLAFELFEPLCERIAEGLPVWGTCAGAILLARSSPGLDRPTLGAMDIVVERNAFGRQLDSFEADLDVAGLAGGPLRAVFIRAPVIREVGPDIEVLARLADGAIVACREGALIATAFHPELTGDHRFHELFLAIAREARAVEGAAS
jgi:5'-phosphate synthase pdxT subunit